jgi:hypothetical protein
MSDMESVRKVAATTVALLIAACGGSGGDGGDGGGSGGGGPDSSPSLTITQPLDGALAMTTLPIDIRCVDDRPGCEVDVRYYHDYCTGRGCTVDVRDYSEVLARGMGGLATTLDLDGIARGPEQGLEFRATDSAGQITTVTRRVFVAGPDPRLTPISTVGGDIADFDGTRVLYFVEDAAGDHPAIYTPSLGVTETIPLEDGWAVYPFRRLSPYSDARLTPDGALFRAERPSEVFVQLPAGAARHQVFLWRSGTLTALPNSENAGEIAVAGRFGIWENGVINAALYRVDTRTGESEVVEPYTQSTADVAADGTVVFALPSGQLVSDRAGQRTSLASRGSDPKIDGTSVVFSTSGSLSLIVGGAAPISLDVPSMTSAGYSPQLAGGWVAFLNTAGQPNPQVYRRDPEGTISRITDFATGGGLLERLAPNGDAMVYRGGARMLSRGTTLTPISGSVWEGRSYWFDGQWYITIGATLLSVDTSGL